MILVQGHRTKITTEVDVGNSHVIMQYQFFSQNVCFIHMLVDTVRVLGAATVAHVMRKRGKQGKTEVSAEFSYFSDKNIDPC